MLVHVPWEAVPGLAHGFLDATECTPGTQWSQVLRARGITAPIITPRQVHGTRVLWATPPPHDQDADAIVCDQRGLLVGVVTADCVPILLRAPRTPTVAAVHAGWRGAAAGVIAATVMALRQATGRHVDLEAVIGPAVGPCCYQVSTEVRAAFQAGSGAVTDNAWRPDGDRYRLDLRRAARRLLEHERVGVAAVLGPCTACSAAHHSYRRDGAAAGRQLSWIGWPA